MNKSLAAMLPRLERVIAITGTRFNRPDAMEPMSGLRDHLLPADR